MVKYLGKNVPYQCRRCKRYSFDPCVRRISWRRDWQPTPVFLPGKSHAILWATVHGVIKSQDMTEVTYQAPLLVSATACAAAALKVLSALKHSVWTHSIE